MSIRSNFTPHFEDPNTDIGTNRKVSLDLDYACFLRSATLTMPYYFRMWIAEIIRICEYGVDDV
jgi:hypothetical protein